jgi:HEAT repeat protein
MCRSFVLALGLVAGVGGAARAAPPQAPPPRGVSEFVLALEVGIRGQDVAAVAAAGKAIRRAEQQAAAARLVDRLLSGPADPATQAMALFALWQSAVEPRMSVPILLRALATGDVRVRRTACQMLAVTAWPAEAQRARLSLANWAITKLAEKVGDPNPEVARGAIRAIDYHIGAAGPDAIAAARDAVPALIRKLADLDPGIRADAASALALFGESAETVPALTDAAQSDQDPNVRRIAARGLGRVRTQDPALKALAAVLAAPGSDLATVLGALDRFKGPAPGALPQLIQAAKSSDPDIRAAAVAVLDRHFPDSTVVDVLAEAAASKDQQVRQVAIRSLGRLEPKVPAAAMALLAIIRPGTNGVRVEDRDAAIVALHGYTGIPKVIAQLADLFGTDTEDESLRLAAGKLLHTAVPVKPLEGPFFGFTPPIQAPAAGVPFPRAPADDPDLALLVQQAIDELEARLQDVKEDPKVRAAAAEALAATVAAPPTTSAVFVPLLAEAIAALVAAEPPRLPPGAPLSPELKAAIPTIARVVGASQPELASTAANILARLGPEVSDGAAKELIAALRSGHQPVASAAAFALGAIGPKEGVSVALAEAMRDAARAGPRNGPRARARPASLLAFSSVSTWHAAIADQLLPNSASGSGAANAMMVVLGQLSQEGVMVGQINGALGTDARRVAEALIEVIRTDGCPEDILAVAVYALVHCGSAAAPAAEPLLKLLGEAKRGTRLRLDAIRALHTVQPGAAAVPELVKALSDPDSGIRAAAIMALGSIGPAARKAVGPLLGIIKNLAEAKGARLSALIALTQVKATFEEALGTAEWALNDPDHDIRVSAIRCLASLAAETVQRGDDGALAHLQQIIDVLKNRLTVEERENTDQSRRVVKELRPPLEYAEMQHKRLLDLDQAKKLESWQSWLSWLKVGLSVWVGHALFWVTLTTVYPRSRWVRSTFFWNRWIRWVAGFVYVPLVLTRIPCLRRRLLRPFQSDLIPDRYRHEFRADSYFAESRISTTRDGMMITEKATDYLRPPLRGRRVVEAPAGYGKTTLIQWFVHQSEKPCVVLRAISCKDGVMEAISACRSEIVNDVRFLRALVSKGGLDIFIDGLNEADSETRERIRTFLNEQFCGNYLLTTQPVLGYKPPQGAEVWRLQPLTVAGARKFLVRQWPRVEKQAIASGVSQERYEAMAQELLDKLGPGSETDPFVLANPLDAALVADLLARNITPDPGDLIAQHVRLARDWCQEKAPGQAPRFDQVGERALEFARGAKPKLELVGLEPECEALLEQKLLSQRGGDLFFRHERIRDYFIALSVRGVNQALELRADSRLIGVFEFLPDTLGQSDADDLGEKLKAESADNIDHQANLVWVRYQMRWEVPGPLERAELLRRRAARKGRSGPTAETPNVVGSGQRTAPPAVAADSPAKGTVRERKKLFKAFRLAVQDSFQQHELELLVREELDIQWNFSALNQPYEKVVFELVEWAKRTGGLRELAEAVARARLGRPDVQEAANALQRLEPEAP